MNKYRNISGMIYAVLFGVNMFDGNHISAALVLVCVELMIIRWTLEDKK